MTEIEIIQGDCLSIMRKMPANNVDCVVTDSPYGHNNNNKGDLIARWEAALGRGDYVPERDDRAIANDGVEANALFRASLVEIARILKPGACCCCCCGGGGPDPQFARWALWLDEVLEFKQMIVWDKGPMGMGWHYRRSYETILVAQKRGAVCKWHDDSHKIENIIRPGAHGIRKIIPNADQHPTQKPVQLAALFIKLHTQRGEIVLDPFMGSGTTGVAAIQEGRHFIGIEIDQQWFDQAQRRIAQAEMRPSLLDIERPEMRQATLF